MLGAHDVVAFVATRDPTRARPFYEGVLGLRVVRDDGFALVLDAHGTTVRVVSLGEGADFRPAPYTVLGWHVPDTAAAVGELSGRGVVFERFPGVEQDERGIWTAPGGAHVAWFRDPDGNVLSVSDG